MEQKSSTKKTKIQMSQQQQSPEEQEPNITLLPSNNKPINESIQNSLNSLTKKIPNLNNIIPKEKKLIIQILDSPSYESLAESFASLEQMEQTGRKLAVIFDKEKYHGEYGRKSHLKFSQKIDVLVLRYTEENFEEDHFEEYLMSVVWFYQQSQFREEEEVEKLWNQFVYAVEELIAFQRIGYGYGLFKLDAPKVARLKEEYENFKISLTPYKVWRFFYFWLDFEKYF
jgi:hypothetical protein